MRFLRRTYLFLILISAIVLLFTQKSNIRILYDKLPGSHNHTNHVKANDSLLMDNGDEGENIIQSVGDWSSEKEEDSDEDSSDNRVGNLSQSISEDSELDGVWQFDSDNDLFKH